MVKVSLKMLKYIFLNYIFLRKSGHKEKVGAQELTLFCSNESQQVIKFEEVKLNLVINTNAISYVKICVLPPYLSYMKKDENHVLMTMFNYLHQIFRTIFV